MAVLPPVLPLLHYVVGDTEERKNRGRLTHLMTSLVDGPHSGSRTVVPTAWGETLMTAECVIKSYRDFVWSL